MIEHRRRNGRTWFEGRLHWLYFWLDLYGPDGRPSHTKVLSAWGFYFALTFECVMGIRMVWTAQMPDMSFSTLVLGTLAIPMGKGVFSKVLGGTTTTTMVQDDSRTVVTQQKASGTEGSPEVNP